MTSIINPNIDRSQLQNKLKELAPWGQSIHVMADIHTPGPLDTEHRWRLLDSMPVNFKGKSVLDAGCNAGYFAFKAEEMGANRVFGIDCNHYINQANFIKNFKKIKNVDFAVCSVFDPPKKEFQISLIMGLLYHLKHPFLAIEKLAKITTEMIVIETEALVSPDDTHKMQFVEHTFRNDDSSWWVPGEECIKGFLRTCGFPHVKSYYFPQVPENPFGFHYSTGKTVEGFPASQRIMIIARKHINSETESFFDELPNVSPSSSFPTTSYEKSQNSQLKDQTSHDSNFYWEEVNEYKRIKQNLEQKNTELIDYIEVLEKERDSWKSAHEELVKTIEKPHINKPFS
ncbi:MAG: hypothetical protein COB02_02325 [Candidatus Cloacimonadota bacterium]|nr:MAG: hypothetical protein COB02_02325 [Candidatus Cloacimonadota bacterium]